MRTAVGSDERSELTDALIAELEERGHEVVSFGPVAGQEESDWPLVCGRVRGLVQVAPPDAVAWSQRAMAARPDSFDTLRGLDIPALVLVGEEDGLATPDDAAAMAAALPDATLVTVPGAGHLTAMERPDAVVAALTTYLARLG